jgi:DNA (cytosine-5)-methyltransferase 1
MSQSHSRPRLLDLFCGAGGCSVGYHRAGFDVVGVDIAAQPHYPFEFVQADALTFDLDGFDVYHASPPCQAYANVTRWRGDQGGHERLIARVRERLEATGRPYVLENVRTRELRPCVVLCGSMFGLPVRRHRGFETSWRMSPLVLACYHRAGDLPFMHKAERAYADAMGCGWMSNREARQAIPPAYTEHIGRELLEVIARFRFHEKAVADEP